MKNKRQLLLIICLVFGFNTIILAQNFPEVSLQTEKGAKFETASLVDGKTPFIVSFWSTTCKPCIQELDAISEQFPDWIEELDFRVVAVSIDDSRSVTRAKSMAVGRGWTDFTLLFDVNQDFKRALNVIYTPQVFIFDKDGKKVYEHSGYSPGAEGELFDTIISL